jgi:signal transduction histidine kinase
MTNLWRSVAFRLALFCGVLVIGSTAVFSAIFYFGTIRKLDQEVDQNIVSISERLTNNFKAKGFDALQTEIQTLLTDKFDVDTEIYFLSGPDGQKVVGNLSSGQELRSPLDQPINRGVIRDGLPSSARLVLHKLPNGSVLVVGRDMKDLIGIAKLIWRTIGIGSVIALVLAIGGTIFFRYLLERRVGAIRQTVEEIEAGNLAKRIPASGVEDEFARLSDDMNRMLDRIELLMDGVRHVSNTIAHNVRTPLGIIRGQLDESLRAGANASRLTEAAEFSIAQVDGLIIVLDKLLQIAESESGTRRQPFKPVVLREVVTTVIELYDAIAEAQDVILITKIEGDPKTTGDKDLLASALANLLDNALKYGGHTVTVSVSETPDAGTVSLVVQDNGPGIPPDQRSKVIQRFYRLDQRVPGTGLGLSIVSAITHLHEATLHLEDAGPGLLARIVLPLFVSI